MRAPQTRRFLLLVWSKCSKSAWIAAPRESTSGNAPTSQNMARRAEVHRPLSRSESTRLAISPTIAVDPESDMVPDFWDGVDPMPDFELPETRYALSGDVNIAYQTMGEGPVDIVVVPGIVSHIEFLHELPGYTSFLRRL